MRAKYASDELETKSTASKSSRSEERTNPPNNAADFHPEDIGSSANNVQSVDLLQVFAFAK
jgi:hypothetical protein